MPSKPAGKYPSDRRGIKCGARIRGRIERGLGPDARCKLAAGAKTDHPGWGWCKYHGGCTPTGRKYAQRLMAEHAANQYALPIVTTPQDALMDEVHRAAGSVYFMQQLVHTLPKEQLTQDMYTPRGEITVKPHVWIEMLDTARAHLVKVSAEAIKCGVAERQVALNEMYGQQIAAALRGILGELGVLDDPRTPEIVGRHLRLVA